MNRKYLAVIVLAILIVFSYIIGYQSSVVAPKRSVQSHTTAPSPYELWEFVNSERINENIPPLRLVEALNQSARHRCESMQTSNKTAEPYEVIISDTYGHASASAENVDRSSSSAVKTVATWVTPGSSTRSSVLSQQYTDAGYAVCTTSETGKYSIVQHLATK